MASSSRIHVFRLIPRLSRRQGTLLSAARFAANRQFCTRHSLCATSHFSKISQRNFSKVKDSFSRELFLEEVFDRGYEKDETNFDLRTYLYPENSDQHIHKLSLANSIEEVFDCLDQIQHIESSHLTQALSTLYYLLKMDPYLSFDAKGRDMKIQEQFMEKLKCDPRFNALVSRMEDKLDETSPRDAAFVMMSLRRLGLSLTSPVMVKLYLKLINNTDRCDLEALSYFSVAVKSGYIQNHVHMRNVSKFSLMPILPRLKELLSKCEDVQELRRIAICFTILSPVISDAMMDMFADKFKKFVEEDKYKTIDGLNYLRKLLALVMTKMDWHLKNMDYTILLMEQHMGQVNKLPPMHASFLFTIFKIIGYPTSLCLECYDRFCNLLENQIDNEGDSEFLPLRVDTMSLIAMILQINQGALPPDQVEQKLRNYLTSEENVRMTSMYEFINIMNSLPNVSPDIMDEFLKQAFQLVKNDPQELFHLMHKHIMAESFIHRNQDLMDSMLSQVEQYTLQALTPTEFARGFAVLLTFDRIISKEVLEKFYSFLGNFGSHQLSIVSTGLRRRTFRQYRAYQPLKSRAEQDENYQVLDEISLAVNRAAQAWLMSPHQSSNFSDLSDILRTIVGSNTYDENLHSILTHKIVQASENLNVGQCNHMCHSIFLSSTQHFGIPDIMDRVIQYLQSSPYTSDLSLRYLGNLLCACGIVYHHPGPDILHICAQALQREFDTLSGNKILSLSCYLAYLRVFPEYLAKAIFSSNFMDRLDREIKANPEIGDKIRAKLMKLNKCMVLQFPEYKVPWFHDAYCKNMDRKISSSKLKDEVYKELCSALGGWRYVKQDSESQLYTSIDFEIGVDESGVLVDLYTDQVKPHRKLAIQVYDNHQFTKDTKKLLGHWEHHNLLLSLEGYQVLTISSFNWNSMYLAESSARVQYLQRTVRAVTSN